MRLRNVKGEVEQIDPDIDTEGMVTDITKLQNQLISLAGVDIFDLNGEFRSTYDILSDLSHVWGNLNSVEQATITSMVAGTTQANLFNSIMSNLATDGAQAVTTALNSQGSAAAENATYMDSIQGRMANLKSSWQSLSSAVISSDLVKGSLSGLTELVNGITTAVDAFGAIPLLLGGIGTIAFAKNFGGLQTVAEVVTELQSGKTIASVSSDFLGLSKSLKKVALSNSGLSKFEQSEQLLNAGYSASEINTLLGNTKKATKGVDAFDTALKGARYSATSFFTSLLANPLTYLVSGMTAVAVAQYKLNHAFDDSVKKSSESYSTYTSTKSQLESLQNEIQNTSNRIQELESLQASGTITLVEEAELSRLQQTNIELEREKSLLESVAAEQKRQAASDAYDALTQNTVKPDLSGSQKVDAPTLFSGQYANGSGILNQSDKPNIYSGRTNAIDEFKRNIDELSAAEARYAETYDKWQKSTDKTEKSGLERQLQIYKDGIDELHGKINDSVPDMQSLREALSAGIGESWFTSDMQSAYDSVTQAMNGFDAVVNHMSQQQLDLNNLQTYFSGTNRSYLKDYVLDKVINDGAKASDVLQQIGVNLDSIGVSDTKTLNRYFSDLAKQADAARKSVSQVDGTLTGMKEAAESVNSGDSFKEIGDFLKSAKELQKQGLIGTDDFKTVAKFIDPDQKNYVKDFTDNYNNLKKYFTQDDDGNWTRKGIDNFVNALSDADKQFANTQQVADELGISTRAVEAIMDRMGDYGLKKLGNGQNVKDIKRVADAYDQASSSLEQLKSVRDNMTYGKTRDVLSKEIEEFEKSLDGDLSNFDPEIAVKIKAELDEAQIKEQIAELQQKINKFGGGENEEDRINLNVSKYRLKKTQEKNIGWNKKEVKQEIPVEYKVMDKSIDALGKRLQSTTDQAERASIQNAQSSLLTAQKNIRQAFKKANKDVDFSNPKETAKALQEWKNSDAGKSVIEDQVAKLKIEPELNAVAESIAALSSEEKIQLGFEADATADQILDQLIGETVEVDAKANVNEVDDSKAKETPIETPAKANVETVETSAIEGDPQLTQLSMSGKVEEVDSSGVKDTEFSGTLTVDEFEAENPTIEATADVTDVEVPDEQQVPIDYVKKSQQEPDQNKESSVNYTIGEQAEPEPMSATANVNEVVNNAPPVQMDGKVTNVDTPATLPTVTLKANVQTSQQVATASGTANYTVGNSPSTVPDAKGTANFDLGKSPTSVPSVQGIANYSMGTHPRSAPTIYGTAIYHKKITESAGTIHFYETKRKRQNPRGGSHKSKGSAYANGAAYARGSGKWTVGENTTALVNEIGRRICDLAW